ncbi:hypothetical protein CR513_52303, partial [Mucuna pruriens]
MLRYQSWSSEDKDCLVFFWAVEGECLYQELVQLEHPLQGPLSPTGTQQLSGPNFVCKSNQDWAQLRRNIFQRKDYTFQGHLPYTTNVTQAVPLGPSVLSDHLTPSPTAYADILKWSEERQGSNSSPSIVHTDFSVINHNFGNKPLLPEISTSGYLTTVTLANGTKTQSQVVVQPILFLPFSLTMCFTFKDRSMGWIIGTRCESMAF